MQLINLLEKRERTIYQLFLSLSEAGQSRSLKELSQELDLSKSTLLRHLESFIEEAEQDAFGLTFRLEEERVCLHRSGQLSQAELFSYLCRSSLKYQILVYLFDKNDFSTPVLSQELLISEATLNRHLSSLNQVLKEFHISIRGGRIRGSELQIRYFYHQLFWHTIPLAQLKKDRTFQEQEAILPIFERFYHSSFNPRQGGQLALWLSIVHKRMRLKELDFEECYRLMAPYEQHKFYRSLRQLFLTLRQQLSHPLYEGDTMSVFAFLFSHRIVEAHQLEQVLGFGGPIMQATSWGLQELKQSMQVDLAIEEGVLYHLNQLFSHIYFFRASLETKEDSLEQYDSKIIQLGKNLIHHVQENYYQQTPREGITHQLVSLSQLYHYLMEVEPASVTVGLASSYYQVITQPILQYLRQQLETNRSIMIERMEEDKEYDLLICYDYPLEGEKIYHLYGYPTVEDIKRIREEIELIYQEKLEQSQRLVERSHFLIERR